jgi:hypothetical protein
VSSRNGRERSFPWDSDNSKTEKNEAIFDEWVKKWQESKIMRSIIDPTKATPGELGSWIVKQRSKRTSLEDGVHQYDTGTSRSLDGAAWISLGL